MSAKSYEHVIPRQTIVIDYEHDERLDTFTISFSGSLLRSEDVDWRELRKALSGLAGQEPKRGE